MGLYVDKKIFAPYFNLLYKFEYANLRKHYDCDFIDVSIGEDDYAQMDILMQELKTQIKNEFELALKKNDCISLTKQFHRLCVVDLTDSYSSDYMTKCETPWIKTLNKIELYYYLLFSKDEELGMFVEFVDYWFAEGDGYWHDDDSRIRKSSITIDPLHKS